MKPSDALSGAIREAVAEGRPALVGFLTGGFPSRACFRENFEAVRGGCDVVEIGVPFSDPMADGTTIQRASFAALADGVTLPWILEELKTMLGQGKTACAPVLLMSYLNPLLSFGLERLAREAAVSGVAGFIVPDLPYEESGEFKAALEAEGLALIQMVTPVTPAERLNLLCGSAQGFVYAVTMTGTTGKSAAVPEEVLDYMDRVKRCSAVPVCAGFGIRSREQVARFRPACRRRGGGFGSGRGAGAWRGCERVLEIAPLTSRRVRATVKRVYRAPTLLQVAHARNVLITAGIRCELRNQYLAGALGDLPMMETWPQLYVDESDEQYALRALSRAAAAPQGLPWTCVSCGRTARTAVHSVLALRSAGCIACAKPFARALTSSGLQPRNP